MLKSELDTITFFSTFRHSKFIDLFLYQVSNFATNFYYSIPIFLIFSYIFSIPYELILLLILGLIFSDQISKLLKRLKNKMRPILFTDFPYNKGSVIGSRSSYCSSHASNIVYTVLIFFQYYPNYFILFLAPLMIYSRLYLGAHWRADTFLGVLVGYLSYMIIAFAQGILL
jgi:undecaprenyl-diphosphatase